MGERFSGGWVRRWASALAAIGLALAPAAVVTTVAVPPAQATPLEPAPGNPGVPSEPGELFLEDFENASVPQDGLLILDYTGADGTTYTAESTWTDMTDCNGTVLTYTTQHTATTPCPNDHPPPSSPPGRR